MPPLAVQDARPGDLSQSTAPNRISRTGLIGALLVHAVLLTSYAACRSIPEAHTSTPQNIQIVPIQVTPQASAAEKNTAPPKSKTPRPEAQTKTAPKKSNQPAPVATPAESTTKNETLPVLPSLEPRVHSAPPASHPANDSPARFDADYLHNPSPSYPALSRRLGEEGKVVLRVFVEADGRPSSIEISTGSGFSRLDQSALSAVGRWKFVPARRGAESIGAWVLVPIIFNLRG